MGKMEDIVKGLAPSGNYTPADMLCDKFLLDLADFSETLLDVVMSPDVKTGRQLVSRFRARK